jgi:hypothetical protein
MVGGNRKTIFAAVQDEMEMPEDLSATGFITSLDFDAGMVSSESEDQSPVKAYTRYKHHT